MYTLGLDDSEMLKRQNSILQLTNCKRCVQRSSQNNLAVIEGVGSKGERNREPDYLYTQVRNMSILYTERGLYPLGQWYQIPRKTFRSTAESSMAMSPSSLIYTLCLLLPPSVRTTLFERISNSLQSVCGRFRSSAKLQLDYKTHLRLWRPAQRFGEYLNLTYYKETNEGNCGQ